MKGQGHVFRESLIVSEPGRDTLRDVDQKLAACMKWARRLLAGVCSRVIHETGSPMAGPIPADGWEYTGHRSVSIPWRACSKRAGVNGFCRKGKLAGDSECEPETSNIGRFG